MNAGNELQGRCGCGAVSYAVADQFEYSLICHCTDCQRATGSAFKPFAGIQAAHFKITQGAERIKRHGDAAGHDARCGDCGSLLYSLVRDGAYVRVTLGTLMGEPAMPPRAHIFIRSKAAWLVIGDTLPQYATFPPG
jgi:hypothetical protein